MISKLDDFLRITFGTTNWALRRQLQCLDNARPTKYMSTSCRTSFLHIVVTNTTKRFLCYLFVGFSDISFLNLNENFLI